MRKEIIMKFMGYIFLFNAAFLFISFIISALLDESSMFVLLYCTLVCIIFGLFPLIFVGKIEDIGLKEGITVVVLGWVITCLVGSLPYIMWGGEFSVINAWFESVSGYTTTGASILTDVEALPRGLLFWRSATHWIGGVGIIFFVLLILPQYKASKITLLHADMSDLSRLNFRYRAKRVIQLLALVYVGLTVLETILLVIAGMSLFDAVNHSFATIATGGFSTRNLSVAYFNNLNIELIIIVFMVLSGIHFGLLFGTFTGSRQNIFRSPVVRAFVAVMIIGVILVSVKLFTSEYYDWWHSLRFASFQVVSLGTSTGFATVDTAFWPAFTQIILIYFTIQTAMVGSTSGGLKFDRVYVFFKSVAKQLKLLRHPKAVIGLKVGHLSIGENLELHTIVFIVLYFFVFFCTTLVLTMMNIDTMTAFSASIATIGNVGPGFGEVGSMANYAALPALGKLVLSINMIFGRLEIFNIIAFFLLRKS